MLSACADAIRAGDVALLRSLLKADPALATARLRQDDSARTLLHIATDWPGHFPNVRATMGALVAHGADVNARFEGRHSETPLHWAASSDDVIALDALLDHGADIEASGAVIGGGTPLADAVAFGCWNAARRLVERGAATTLWQAAALGLLERMSEAAGPEEVTRAFWCACHGGQLAAAEQLLARGADLHWVGWDHLTALGAAQRSGAVDVVAWLKERGAISEGPVR